MIVNKSPGKDISHDDIKNKIPLVAKKNKKHFSKINISGVIFGGKKIPIFAGPNTVENKKMIFDIAKNVKRIGASFLRGGAFKPLTFPYRSKKYFETELKGIEWLGLAKEKYKIPVITEVTDTKFLKEICQVADILQIGSRNMQNFPLIIDCAQTGKPIMLKRHYGASLRDWLGAAEYILKEGNFKVILCERGVSTSHTHSPTSRFLIDLQVVPAAKEITHLPIIVDPSHATFCREWVESMSLASVASGADGIMLEVHPRPAQAAVDPLQSVNYKKFREIFNKIKKIAKVVKRKI
tara:strand:+ start:1887 stop:2771 length:885 start_codon:yes stop_codon:yes gene_type:complete